MLHKNAIKYVKQEYTLIFIYYVIRFGIIRFGSVRIPKLRYSVFRYFTRFGRSLFSSNIPNDMIDGQTTQKIITERPFSRSLE